MCSVIFALERYFVIRCLSTKKYSTLNTER